MDTKYVWHVRLVNQDNSIGTLALLNFLADSLKEPSCAVLKIDENYYLVSEDFESLQDYREVTFKAMDALHLLWQLIKIKLHPYQLWGRPRLEIGDIYQLNKEGKLINREKRQIEPTFITQQLLETANSHHPTLSELWTLSHLHPEIQEVLQYYNHYLDWVHLYKIYEVIKADIKKQEKLKKLPSGTLFQWTQGRKLDFEQSAHSAYISGTSARHSFAGSRKVQNVTPMSLDEAQVLIDEIFFAWVRSKIP